MKESKYYTGKLDLKCDVRLLLVHPISPRDGHEGPFHLPAYVYLLTTTSVDEIFCAGAPRSIEGPADSEKVMPFIVEKVRWAESQGYNAVIINCMLDPGLTEAKRVVAIPVIGLREANRAIASLVGKNPAHIYPQNIPVLELSSDEDRTVRELVKIGQTEINDNNADVLILNCGYLGGLAQRLQMKLGVPVLANLDVALRLAELLAIFDIRPKLRQPKALEGLNTSQATKDANTSQKRGIASLVRSLVKRYF